MLKAIFFDLGNTLIESDNTLETFNREYTWPKLQELRAQSTYEDFLTAKQQVIRELASNESAQATRPYPEIVPFFKFLADKMSLENLSTEQSREIEGVGWRQFLAYINLFPGALNVLHWIHDLEMKLTVVSNWYQHYVLDYLDILPLFDTVMTSEKASANKAELRPFQLTLDELDVKPEQTIHVGDSITQDGACQRLGIRFIYSTWHLTGHSNETNSNVSSEQYDFTAQEFSELISLLESLIR